MREAHNIEAVMELDIDMMGFIFYPQSSRYVSHVPNVPSMFQYKYKACNNKRPKVAGVFVNDTIENILHKVTTYQLDCLQLHGQESVHTIRQLKQVLQMQQLSHVEIIKAINIATPTDFDLCQQYEDVADMLLFDTKGTLAGGNGKTFDWTMLNAYQGSLPFLLSGGIGIHNVDALCHLHHPRWQGIDVNSQFELSPALKDTRLLASFITKIRTFKKAL